MKTNLLKFTLALLPAAALTFDSCSNTLLAQDAASVDKTTNPAESLSPPPYRPWTVGTEIGSTGIGGFGAWRFQDHLGVRTGFDFFKSTDKDVGIKDINYSTKLRLLSEPLTLDIYPWKKHSFHISAGLQFNQNELTGSASDTGTIIIAGHPFPSDRVGSLNLKVEQQPVNPYLSIGGTFFHFDRAHRWAMGGELGVTYTGNAKVSLSRTGPDGPLTPLIEKALSSEQAEIQDWANRLKWFPVLKLTVSYSF